MTAHDLYKNQQIHMLDTFTVILTKGVSSVTGTVTPISNGYYWVQYVLSEVGLWRMDITIKINGLGSSLSIKDSPFLDILVD